MTQSPFLLPEEIQALELTQGRKPTSKELERMSQVMDSAWVRWGIEQWQLRAIGARKFDRAHEMVFVREALEQATHEQLARWRARRFPQGELVADLTCGIGGDLIALAQRGPALGFELDPERARFARHNLWVHELQAEIREQSCLEASWDFAFAFADPARRSGGVRTYDPSHFSPDPAVLAQRMQHLELAALKLSPMLFDPYLESLGASLEFVEYGAECREALVWSGKTARPGRYACDAENDQRVESSPTQSRVDEPKAYLVEASPARIRAHALGSLGIAELGDSNGYLTCDQPVVAPMCQNYKVAWTGRFDRKAILAELRRRNSATPVIKQRGTKQDLQQLHLAWRLSGDQPFIVVLWATGKNIRATLVETIDQSGALHRS